MTCAHVLGLIDAGDFADYPRDHLDAAWRHARECATCGPALESAARFTSDLAALPQPAPPRELLTTVLARIEQIEHAETRSVSPGIAATTSSSRMKDWLASSAALGGAAAGLAIVLATAPDVSALINARPRFGMVSAGMPPASADTAILAAGLALYVTGLFSPLRGRS